MQVYIMSEGKSESYTTIRVTSTMAHWLAHVSSKVEKTQIQVLKELIEPLYKQSLRMEGKANLKVVKSMLLPMVTFSFQGKEKLCLGNTEQREEEVLKMAKRKALEA